jgi:hypothetical protein
MRKIKKLMGILLLALVVALSVSPAFAGDGAVETPGLTYPGAVETPGLAAPTGGAVETPGLVSILLDLMISLM